MWRKTGIAAISVLSLVLMTTVVYPHEGTAPEAVGQGMMGHGMTGQGMMGMCGGMMGQGMGGMMGHGMMGMMGRGMMGGRGIGAMMGDPVCGILHQFGGPGFYGIRVGQLDLSEDQRTQLEGIWSSHLKGVIRKRADLQVAQLELKEALGKETPDYGGAKSGIKQINDLRGEIALDHLNAIQKARKVLTPEQLKKLKSLRRMPMGARQGMMSVPQGEQREHRGMMGGEGTH